MLCLLWGLGWGGDVTVPWTCTHGRCYVYCGVWGVLGMLPFFRSLNLHTWSMLRLLWGVGWGGGTHGRCYVFCGVWGGLGMLPFLRSLNLHTWSMLRLLRGLGCVGDVTVPSFLEFAHMVVAMSSVGFGVSCGCYRSFVPWTFKHGRCCVFCGVWGGVGMLPFLRSLNLHTWSMLCLLWGLGWVGDVTVPSFLELAHMLVDEVFGQEKNSCSLQRRSSFPGFWNTEFSCCLKTVLFFSS